MHCLLHSAWRKRCSALLWHTGFCHSGRRLLCVNEINGDTAGGERCHAGHASESVEKSNKRTRNSSQGNQIGKCLSMEKLTQNTLPLHNQFPINIFNFQGIKGLQNLCPDGSFSHGNWASERILELTPNVAHSASVPHVVINTYYYFIISSVTAIIAPFLLSPTWSMANRWWK